MNNTILLVLKDEEDISFFTRNFFDTGFEIIIIKDCTQALDLSIKKNPALILADLSDRAFGVEDLFKTLRVNPQTSGIPFLFIAKSENLINGFRHNDAFFLRPLSFPEVYGRIRQILSMTQGAEGRVKELEGSLDHITFADIMQFLHLNKKEGELRICAGSLTGSVFIKNGEVYNSVAGRSDREKALFRLLTWERGRFEFIPGPVNVEKKINASVGNLLMEGVRQADELKKKKGHFPDKTVLLKTKFKASALPKGLHPVVYEILDAVKEHPFVEDLVDECMHADYEVYSAIVNMMGKGILETDKASDRAPEFVSPELALGLRGKIVSSFKDMVDLSYAKILVISTSEKQAARFTAMCRQIHGFEPKGGDCSSITGIRLYGGMELLIFPVPAVRNMGPLWKSLYTNLIGLVLTWDCEGVDDIKELEAAKKYILSLRRIPAVYAYSCKDSSVERESLFRDALNLKFGDQIFRMDSKSDVIVDIFHTIFNNILRNTYAAS